MTRPSLGRAQGAAVTAPTEAWPPISNGPSPPPRPQPKHLPFYPSNPMATTAALRVTAARALASPAKPVAGGKASDVVEVDYAGSAGAAVRKSGLGR